MRRMRVASEGWRDVDADDAVALPLRARDVAVRQPVARYRQRHH